MNQGAYWSDLLFRVALTALAVILSSAVERALETLQVNAPYLVFLPVITGACAFYGFGMGLCAIALSAVGLWYFFIPPNGFDLPNSADFAHLCVFIAVAYFGCRIVDGLRRSNDELSRDNVVLGCKVSTLLSRKKTH
jgi:K+-sensing histidine kinase KdpD